MVRLARIGIGLGLTLALTGCIQVSTPASPAPTRGRASGRPTPAASLGQPTSAPSATPAATATAAGTAAAPPGTDGSIAYVNVSDGNIWLAAPDGSSAHALTSDGAAGGYHDPAQAADGTILALRGTNELVAIDRSSGAVTSLATLPVLENGAEGLVVAPDAAHIAYVTTGFGTYIDPRFGTPTGAFIYGGTDVADLAGESVPGAALAGMVYPAWIDAQRLLVGDGTAIYTATVGAAPQVWLDLSNGCLTDFDCPADSQPAATLSRPTIDAAATTVAFDYEPYYGSAAGRAMMAFGGQPSSDPAARCVIAGQQAYSDVGSFSPDGSRFAFDDTQFDPVSLETSVGEGIRVFDVDLAADECGAAGARLVLPGGAQPAWGPLAP